MEIIRDVVEQDINIELLLVYVLIYIIGLGIMFYVNVELFLDVSKLLRMTKVFITGIIVAVFGAYVILTKTIDVFSVSNGFVETETLKIINVLPVIGALSMVVLSGVLVFVVIYGVNVIRFVVNRKKNDEKEILELEDGI